MDLVVVMESDNPSESELVAGEEAIGAVDSSVRSDEVGGERGPDGGGGGVHGSDRRLGHVSERGLVELSKQGMLCGDKVEKLNFCEHCVYGKTCKAKFGVGQQRTKGILDLIHADLWGPSRTLSHSQN